MRVIGTAGHVDHGKSTLVQALTGIHPDRLKEEREREMTIDLGFAWLSLPAVGGNEPEEVGIVDVPGHRDFIENMLAGIGGIDAVLFVVAADEGVMPQTREHLAILDLLQIQGGVVALTKIDLIDESNRQEWLDLVEADLRLVFSGTVLAGAPIQRVSARTAEGIPEMKIALAAHLANKPARPDLNRPRLPIDRAFTIPGFGSVVTGTLSDGQLRLGDEVEILPEGSRGRVRGLQTHKRKEQVALPGSRTAVNVSGVPLEKIQRGDVVALPGSYQPSQRIDVDFRLLPEVSQPLKHNTQLKLFIGSAEVIAQARLLGSEELRPGQSGWLQLELTLPVVAMRGDRFILRRPSPGETIGGGSVVDPHPKGRHKRFSSETLNALQSLASGTPSDILLEVMLRLGAATLGELISRSHLESPQADKAVQELVESGLLINLENDSTPQNFLPANLVISRGLWEQIAMRMLSEVEVYHQAHPLRRGLPREELKSRLKPLTQASPALFNLSLRRLGVEGKLQETGALVQRNGYTIQFTPMQEQNISKLMARFAASPYSPPTLKECQVELGEELVSALVDLQRLVQVPPDLVFRKEDYDRMLSDVRHLIRENGSITVASARDHFNTSRRYVLALLEHLDATGFTVRDGDLRRLK